MDLLLPFATETATSLGHYQAARFQMALTLGFHIVLACFGVGLPLLMVVAEALSLKTGDAGWRSLAQRWSKAFAVLFAVGAVSGTVLSFELGLLWPGFMSQWGSVIGLSFTLEGFAFFLEAIFVGIYLYGWDRLSPRAHMLAGIPIAISGALSAAFVMTVNAWMQCPQGYDLNAEGQVVAVRLSEVLWTPATGPMTLHMLLSAYIVTGTAVAAVYAWLILRGDDSQHNRRALTLALALALPLAPVQGMVGHSCAQVLDKTQKVKLAAMKGQWQTERRAPLRFFGWPDEDAEETRWCLEIPGLLSWMSTGDFNAEIKGLKDFEPELRPNVWLCYWSFQVMVFCGSYLILLGFVAALFAWRSRARLLSRPFLWAVVLTAPASLLAMEAGWVLTEVGRQPWVVFGVQKTRETVTQNPKVPSLIFVTLAVYAVLSLGTVAILRRLAKTEVTP